MRTYLQVFLTIAFGFIFQIANAQITNIKINNQEGSFSFFQGNTLSWSYNLPAGDSAHIEIWMDLNNNHYPDDNDKLLYSFNQIDGDTTSQPGQFPDADNIDNGTISYTLNEALPPGRVLITFYSPTDGSGAQVEGFINGVGIYQSSLSGKVTAPAGMSSDNILVRIKVSVNGYDIVYDVLTDANGSYIIGNQGSFGSILCSIYVEEPFAGYISEPPMRNQLLIQNEFISGLNFSFSPVVAKVTGYLRDDDNTPLRWSKILLRNASGDRQRNTLTNDSGWYSISVDSADIPTGPFTLESGTYSDAHSYALTHVDAINHNDSLSRNVIAYKNTSTISGRVTNNGSSLHEVSLVATTSGDSGFARTVSEYGSGLFTFHVSNKISTYYISPDTISIPAVQGHPGDTGLVVSIVTSVRERENGIPGAYQLYQNFPNPFNPTTVINYDIAANSRVRMVLINILGQEIARMVDQEQSAGRYAATIDASNLPSGVYFYRLQVFPASPMQQPMETTRKLVVMK
jgi:hypothetical protein